MGGGMQGIAYHDDAGIKPVDIFTDDIYQDLDSDKLKAAIEKASGTLTDDLDSPKITAMNNGWNLSTTTEYIETDDSGVSTTYEYERASELSTIADNQINGWVNAVVNTVVVFGAGDNGHNSENGLVKLTPKTTGTAKEVRWSSIDVDSDDPANSNRNIASPHARLPVDLDSFQGEWLSVIALKPNNRIWEYSNGCGDAKNWCIGAPGFEITSSVPSTSTNGALEVRSGTAQAAAHVTGAIAVVASTFVTNGENQATPEKLVAIILNTADDLGIAGVDEVYGHGIVNLARATDPIGRQLTTLPDASALAADASLDNSGITLPTSFGGALDGFTVGFIDDYKRAYIGSPTRITRTNAAFTLADTIATWDSPELQNIALDSNSKMQFTNYDESEDAKDTLIFTHTLPNHTIGFSYNEESKTPDLRLADKGEELHFQKIRPIANDLMQLHATHRLGKKLTVKNAITSGEFDTGNRFNEAMANLNYTGENNNLTIGAGTLQEYGQFLGASGTGAYQLSDATQSTVTHLAISQNLPRNSSVKVKYTNFKTEVDMRYDNFAKINDLTADEYQLTFAKKQILGKNDSLNIELIQPFAVTDGTLQQSTVLGYTEAGDYNNVTQNYTLKPANRRQQLRMTWQNQINHKTETKLFISMQYENHVDNLRDKEQSSILGGISTKF